MIDMEFRDKSGKVVNLRYMLNVEKRGYERMSASEREDYDRKFVFNPEQWDKGVRMITILRDCQHMNRDMANEILDILGDDIGDFNEGQVAYVRGGVSGILNITLNGLNELNKHRMELNNLFENHLGEIM